MRKKAQVVFNEKLITAIVIVVVIFITSVIFIKVYFSSNSQGNKAKCGLDAQQFSYANQDVRFACPIITSYVMADQLNPGKNRADAIRVATELGFTEAELEDNDQIQRFLANYKIAKEMTDCWIKTGNLQKKDDDDAVFEELPEGVAPGEDPEYPTNWQPEKLETYERGTTYCVVCSRINFDPKIKPFYDDGSLNAYLKKVKSPSFEQNSLYEAFHTQAFVNEYDYKYIFAIPSTCNLFDLSNKISKKEPVFSTYSYELPANLAVVYYKTWLNCGDINGEYSGIKLIDYNDLANECQFVANTYS